MTTSNKQTKIATAAVSRSALQHNLHQLRRLAPHSRLMAVIKANAYGHGLVETAKILQSADCLAVARLQEALQLRAAGVQQSILVLEGVLTQAELPVVVEQQLDIVVHSEEQLIALESATLTAPINVWMKLDSGMHRLGIRPEYAEKSYQRLVACRNVTTPINLLSHFSRADELSAPTTEQQISCFEQFIADKPGERSLAASSGILFWPQSHYDWVRSGIALYGISPVNGSPAMTYGLKPAMTLKSCLIAVREHLAGEPVGYGGIWTSTRDTKIGIVAIGYGDGYPRDSLPGTPVWLNGREVPIVGRISMDMLSVDLGATAQDQVGDEVILWGEQLPIERVSSFSGIFSYELVTGLTQRIAIEYID